MMSIALRTFREIGFGLVLAAAWVTSFMPKGSMAPGPERPDAAKGDQKIAERHGFEMGHPRRSLSGRTGMRVKSRR
jgi:hypothetical protein